MVVVEGIGRIDVERLDLYDGPDADNPAPAATLTGRDGGVARGFPVSGPQVRA